MPEFKPLQTRQKEEACYRLMPFHGAGAGGFTCLLHKKGEKPPLPPLADELLAWPIHAMNSQIS